MPFIQDVKCRFHEDLSQKNRLLKIHGVATLSLLVLLYVFMIGLGSSEQNEQKVDTWGAPFDHTSQTWYGSVETLYGRGAGSGELWSCLKNYRTKDHRLIVAVGKNFCYTSPHGSSFDRGVYGGFLIFLAIPFLALLSAFLYLASLLMKSRWALHIVMIPLDLILLAIWFALFPTIWISFHAPFVSYWRG